MDRMMVPDEWTNQGFRHDRPLLAESTDNGRRRSAPSLARRIGAIVSRRELSALF